jgi:hypothetical protein
MTRWARLPTCRSWVTMMMVRAVVRAEGDKL